MKILYRIKWFLKEGEYSSYGSPYYKTKGGCQLDCSYANIVNPTIQHYPEKCVYGDFRDRFVIAVE